MDWLEQSTANCSVARALELVGEKWSLLILREIFNGACRFDEICAHAGVPRPVLAQRLARLVEAGVLKRTPYREAGKRQRDEYRLTEMGADLYPVILALRQWGDRYLADPAGPARVSEHLGCGANVELALRCDAGHLVSQQEVAYSPGPGARHVSSKPARRRRRVQPHA